MNKDKEARTPLLSEDNQENINDEDELEMDNVSSSSMQPMISEEANNEEVAEEGTEEGTEEGIEASNDSIINQYITACQRGDLTTVQKMVEHQIIDIGKDYDSSEKISGLHWASVNNRLSIVQYLISQGSDVNYKAGTLHATPLHWAASHGYVYIVDYLLKHGADPCIKDDQGFNLLHLAVNSSNIMLVIYVLFNVVEKGILDVDCVDPHGRTPLLWAAYQGDSLTVNSLLQFGANVKICDDGGFSPLHWGVVKGQPHVLKYLIKNGGDFFQKTKDDKDCFIIAKEMNTQVAFDEALKLNGFDTKGFPKKKVFKKSLHAKQVTFVIPFIYIGISFGLMSYVPVVIALLLNAIIWFGIKISLEKFIMPCYNIVGIQNTSLLKSPFLSGVFFGSVIWVVIVWCCKILPVAFWEEPIWNSIFGVSIIGVIYEFYKLIRSNPGRKNRNHDMESVRKTIQTLMELGKFDIRHFCLETWVRKPLRSKFSYLNQSVVNRYDHYCPWVYNDIGLRNHKRFIMFIFFSEVTIWSFVIVCFEYFDELEVEEDAKCLLMGGGSVCKGVLKSRFTLLLMVWSMLQGVWVMFLICVQLFQMLRGITNNEFNKLANAHESMVGSRNEIFNTTPEGYGEVVEESRSMITSSTSKRRNIFGLCMSVIGLDQWVLVVRETLGFARGNTNEEESALSGGIDCDYGWRINVKDFWLTSDTTAPLWQRIIYSPQGSKALLNDKEVDYDELYEWPRRVESV
ncbi:hypothetical protein TBLA_0J00830 [Henningerozyma blattae CBS 6284]|uniref:Palmitoyltransferase n=1 Tax=Henningerozyma blattae (strain ATCC 34711 / CBS 6284 / DSM 70876 / NBRC 10599 / NRRL Y-10934 / UCD 77-7) TaxID=1071380 RepID=I2H9M9_HENB6|nr:hypothetical protein TBLA_0J00830 [Tetrapisispora blattae CBS 6284]CCH63081.1 hypothetical protein TBLA_0J00830 [Tetrapisispora blattae CBS 6284]